MNKQQTLTDIEPNTYTEMITKELIRMRTAKAVGRRK